MHDLVRHRRGSPIPADAQSILAIVTLPPTAAVPVCGGHAVVVCCACASHGQMARLMNQTINKAVQPRLDREGDGMAPVSPGAQRRRASLQECRSCAHLDVHGRSSPACWPLAPAKGKRQGLRVNAKGGAAAKGGALARAAAISAVWQRAAIGARTPAVASVRAGPFESTPPILGGYAPHFALHSGPTL